MSIGNETYNTYFILKKYSVSLKLRFLTSPALRDSFGMTTTFFVV
jgi:hypothetical protein